LRNDTLEVFLLYMLAVYNGDKLTHFAVSKNDNKISMWGNLGTSPHNVLAVSPSGVSAYVFTRATLC